MLAIFILIGVSIILIVLYFVEHKGGSFKFTNLSSLIQTIFVFVGLGFSIYTLDLTLKEIESSNLSSTAILNRLDSIFNSSNNVKFALDDVSLKLIKLPSQLDSFSFSISKLNHILNTQNSALLKNISSLENNVGLLNQSIAEYRNYINDYGKQLGTIVKQTDVQLEIWEKQQQIIKEEFSKVPILKFDYIVCERIDSIILIKSINLSNVGNDNAEIVYFCFNVPNENLIEFKVSGFTSSKTTFGDRSSYSFTVDKSGTAIVYLYIPSTIPTNIKYKYKEGSHIFLTLTVLYKGQYKTPYPLIVKIPICD